MNSSDQVTWLRCDQRQRWQNGDRVPVEAYLQKQPGLRGASEAVLDLIYNEIVLREEGGETPRLDEYLGRFPEYANDLRLQFDVHRAIVEDRLSPDAPTAESRGLPSNGHVASCKRSPPPVIDGYEILGELGRGGMGVVYQARQLDLKRIVALKMIRAGAHASPVEQTRFLTEARAIARLQHPNIVQIYAVGEQDSSSFFALEFIDGPSIDKRFGPAALPPRQAAQLVETLARAMHYAHQRGIIHRDLKPSNVLMGSDGAPKITDFGLAKLLDVQSGQTPPEGLLGTPHYMAPEQAFGHSEVGPRADVYSLGAILYELLTGGPPFEGTTMAQVLDQVRSQDPIPPWILKSDVPRELETICLKCLEKQPAKRYASALELGEDLRRFLANEPILARPSGAWERSYKWVRRRPMTALLILMTSAAAFALLGLVLWHRSDLQAQVAQAQWQESKDLKEARAKYEQFQRWRDDALFYGIGGALIEDLCRTNQREDAEGAARRALGLVNLEIDAHAAPELDPHWSDQEKTQLVRGCYELLMLLSDAAARPTPVDPATLSHGRGDPRRALAVLERAAGLGTPTRSYHVRKARYLDQLGDREGAAREQALAESLQPADAIDYFLFGHDLFWEDKLEPAAEAFRAALLEQPKDFWSRLFLAACYIRLNRPGLAEGILRDCREQRPSSAMVHLLLWQAHELLGKVGEAEEDCRRVAEFGSSEQAQFLLYVHRSRLEFDQGKWKDASDDLQHAIALMNGLGLSDSARAKWHAQLASCFYRAGRYVDCIAASNRSLKLRPKDVDVNLLQGKALVKLGRYAEAVGALARYREFGGKPEADLFRQLGWAHFCLKDYTAAAEDYSAALALQPAADLYLQRGWAYFFADAWKLAQRDFEKVLQLDDNLTDAYTGRGLSYAKLGQYVEAVTDAERAFQMGTNRPEMMHNIACIFASLSAKADDDSSIFAEKAAATRLRGRAIEALRRTFTLLQADERQSFWREKVLPEKDLEPVLHLPEFQRLKEEVLGGQPAR